ncbi:WD40-repeat-containing domain protein [Fomes fomentarius]|nr:WD40-repeat-containing domain protein [Fomes fomentarius]
MQFFAGDELGAIKSISYTPDESEKTWKAATTLLAPGCSSGKSKPVQKLALHRAGSDTLLTAAHADGEVYIRKVLEDSQLAVVHEWSETRLKAGQRFVGLSATDSAVYSCTSNGALRLTKVGQDGSEPASSLAALPMRLCDWRLSEGGRVFAYGGNEVELSLWDTEKAFAIKQAAVDSPAATESKKRKRDQYLPGELWRAKNLPNDHLSLRQSVHNTALTFLQPSASATHQHLLVGTTNGSVRRYDTRAARRPVSDWKVIAKSVGISTVETSLHEHEVFIADHGCTLSALDLRNGKTIYTYKGIAGAVTSVAPARSFMASASQDRFVRLHTTFGPPAQEGQQQDQKGQVMDKLYMKVIPTVVIWDGEDASDRRPAERDEEGGDDDVWNTMQAAESDYEDEDKAAKKKTRAG